MTGGKAPEKCEKRGGVRRRLEVTLYAKMPILCATQALKKVTSK